MKKANSLGEFAELVDNGKHVFFFTADWCGDCQYIKPVLPEIEKEFPEYEFIEVNRDHFIDICQKWNIMGIPSFVVIEDGQEKGRFANKNRKTKEQIIDFLNQVKKNSLKSAEVSNESQEYKNILIGVDGSHQSKNAFYKAIEVAKRNQAKIILVNVIENQTYSIAGYSSMNTEFLQNENQEVKNLLEELKDYAHATGFDNIETVVSFGSPKSVITKEIAPKYHVDLIMIGQSGLNAVERFMMGSVSSYVIRHSPCDVLIVRST